jgi:O-antigen ligase
MAQGGHYPEGRRITVISLAVVITICAAQGQLRGGDLLSQRTIPFGVLAVWFLISAALSGDIAAALPTATLLLGVIFVLAMGGRIAADHQTLLASGLVALGAIVAVTGWIGVAWRLYPWAIEDNGLWRAATSLTYSNAAAGLMVPLFLLAVALLSEVPHSRLRAVGAYIVLVGIAATLSRGGLLAMIVGVVILGRLLGPTRLRVLAGPTIGALIAIAGLMWSIPAGGSAPRPLVASLAFAIGSVVAFTAGVVTRRTNVVPRLLLCIACLGTTLALATGLPAVSAIAESRATIGSPERLEQARVALSLVRERPLVGTGPGRAVLSWTDADGRRLTARYVHNEYLQIAAEVGLIGFALLVVLLCAIGRSVWRARPRGVADEHWAGVVAGLTSVGFHSSVEFLWQIPAIPLVAALLIAIGCAQSSSGKDDVTVRSTVMYAQG